VARQALTLTEGAVLGLLTLEGERSGYDLLQLAKRSVGYVWRPAKSQLYATLERLARDGLVLRRQATASPREKQLYAVSRHGRRVFAEWLATVGGPPDEQVLKMFLGGLTDRDTLIAHVEQYRLTAIERLAMLEHVDAYENTRTGEDFFHGLVLDLGLATTRAAVDWADSTLERLRACVDIHFAPGGAAAP
jgi:DNA-binding PadR family transcriptional regulator